MLFVRFLSLSAFCLCLKSEEVSREPKRLLSLVKHSNSNGDFSEGRRLFGREAQGSNSKLNSIRNKQSGAFSATKETIGVSRGQHRKEEPGRYHVADKQQRPEGNFARGKGRKRTRRNVLRLSREAARPESRRWKPHRNVHDIVPQDQDWLQELLRDDSSESPADWCQQPQYNTTNHAHINLGGRGRDTGGSKFITCPRTKHCRGGTEAESSDGGSESARGPRSRTCGEGFCCCCDIGIANCSGHQGNLHYIPKLPNDIIVLIFSENNLVGINTTDFFDNVTKISHLDLSYNQLRHLNSSAFDKLHNLTVLYLDNNYYLDFSAYRAAVFTINTLEALDLSNAYAGTLPEDVFYIYPLPRLRRLHLNSVDLRTWNATVFQRLESLELLDLSQNDMRFISTNHIQNLSSLRSLILVQNDLYDFPRSCQNANPIYPKLEWLNLNDNRITHLPKHVCFPKLRVLYLTHNPISSLVTNMFHSAKFPSLNCLHAQNMKVWNGIHPYAFNNSALRYLDLMYNNVDFNIEKVAKDSFQGLHNVVFLQLEHNYIGNHRFMEIFSGLTALQYVYIGNTNMDKLKTDTFAAFPQLQSIKLHRNYFWTIPDGVFDGLQHLRQVDLSNCRITTISEKTFSSDTRRRLKHLDLSGNHFHCDCDLFWFRDWLSSNDSVFNKSYTEYKCSKPHKTRVADYRMNPQVCLMSHDASVFTVVVVTMLMIILTLVAVVFRYRWSIRLLLYEAFRGKGRNSQLPANYFRFDAFVSYAEEDVTWVRKHLIEELEPMEGVRLCVHQRDFTPGQNIVDNIYQSVQDSRKVMMVFSRHFARSQWCQFELALCLSHVVEHDDTMLIACVDDVTSSTELTPTMMAVLNTTTYIQWAEEDDAKASFWGRMRIALSDTAPAIRARNQHPA